MTVSRRAFLQAAAATTGGVLVGGPLQALVASGAGGSPGDRFRTLGPVADLRDGIVRLHLPPGFQYRSFHDTDGPAITLDDGTVLPGRHDGMAAFPGPDGNVWLIRNHEVNGNAVGGAFGPGVPYDSAALGGTTTSLVTPAGEVLNAFTSLNGTQMNCAGGGMPWGAWISCEETVNGPDVGPDFTGVPNDNLQARHGFIFEVPAGDQSTGQSSRQPIQSAGRFAHEAAAYSPDEGIVYLTEDNFGFPSGLFRYLPPSNPVEVGFLEDGGTLQMLRVVDMPEVDLAVQQEAGATYPVDWVTIDDPAPTFPAGTTNNDAIVYVGNQGRAQGAAWFSRLEGASFVKGEIFFVATQGGGLSEGAFGPIGNGYGNGTGQVWSYDPGSQMLTCRYQAPEAPGFDETSDLDLPDNITARNDRGSIVICEDGPTNNFIRGLDRHGQLFDIALNRLLRNAPPFAERFGEEFAGATFSPDGGTLFVNTQASQGITYAIFGPWGRIGV